MTKKVDSAVRYAVIRSGSRDAAKTGIFEVIRGPGRSQTRIMDKEVYEKASKRADVKFRTYAASSDKKK